MWEYLPWIHVLDSKAFAPGWVTCAMMVVAFTVPPTLQ